MFHTASDPEFVEGGVFLKIYQVYLDYEFKQQDMPVCF